MTTSEENAFELLCNALDINPDALDITAAMLIAKTRISRLEKENKEWKNCAERFGETVIRLSDKQAGLETTVSLYKSLKSKYK